MEFSHFFNETPDSFQSSPHLLPCLDNIRHDKRGCNTYIRHEFYHWHNREGRVIKDGETKRGKRRRYVRSNSRTRIYNSKIPIDKVDERYKCQLVDRKPLSFSLFLFPSPSISSASLSFSLLSRSIVFEANAYRFMIY